MKKPYIVCHMLVSIDGKITGDYMQHPTFLALCEEYYRINRAYQADAFLCGRITMEGSFTGSVAPDLSPYQGAYLVAANGKDAASETVAASGKGTVFSKDLVPEGAQTAIKGDVPVPEGDFVAKTHGYYAVAIDPHGRLGWTASEISDEDPGYDNAHIIEVLTEKASVAYRAFLRAKGISYIVCGKERVDVSQMNQKLCELFDIRTLLLEGGGLTDTLLLEADVIDEINLVVVPLVGGRGEEIDLFARKNCPVTAFPRVGTAPLPNGGLRITYKKENDHD